MTIVRYLLFPILFGGSLTAAWAGFRAGFDPAIWTLVVTVGNLVVVAVLEHALPRKPEVSLLRDRQSPNDLLHAGLLSVVGVPAGQAIASVGVAAIAGAAGEAGPKLWWPDGWPFFAQLVLVVLIADFFDYWKHRAYHRFDWLWWFHAVHHSTPTMHALKAGRLHFAEGIIRYLVVTTPLAILGAPAELLLWYVLLQNFFGNLNHTNLDLRFPRFAHYLIATLDYHYLHHARERRLQDSNFAGTPLIDLLFGTFHDPTQHPVVAVGIEDDPVPSGFFAQLLLPFRKLTPTRRAPRVGPAT
jgi:sterol desaturase/sphingolipid hydroxylase (fatty acid hydroxylase superfamily)